MIDKLFNGKTKKANFYLDSIHITSENVDECTPYSSFSNISRKFNPKAPSCSTLLKVLKNEDISINFLIKTSTLIHFFIKNEAK